MTSTLETALSGLPAKPRVHELSKRIGISNKELLAALAARGLSIKSASASVPLAVAQSVIEELIGERAGEIASEAPGDGAAESAGDSAPIGATDDSTAAAQGHDYRESGGDPFNPLFLPPAETQPEPDEQGSFNADLTDTEPAEESAPARSGSRRRRGRSGGRKPAQEPNLPADEVEPAGAEPPEIGQEPPVDAEGGAEETFAGELSAPESAGVSDDADEDSAARGRRRRRGRRGRGRVSDADEQTEDQLDQTEEPASSNAQDEAPESAEDVEKTTEPLAAGASESDSDSDSDGDRDTESSSAGNRRRRRRRRRSTGDEAPRDDDPDNTVVHVREPRLSQANAPSGGAGTAPSNEVQGVRGSTRLEAKRQRRRDSRDSSRRRPQILTEAEFLARRESVERIMAVRQRGDLAQVALLEDGILVEHFVSQTGSDSMIGSVFLGKVQNVLPSMEAAFVDIGRGRNAVIYAGEVNWDAAGLGGKARRIETALSSGDTILAQVSKDPVGHKGARLTTQISLPGRFVVYVPGGGATGISRKLPDTERRRLKSIMDRIVPEDAGVIIRTAAEGIDESELAADVERLKSQWEEITRRAAEKTSAPTQLYAEPGTLIKVVRDLFNSDITRLVVDGDDAYEPVREYIDAVAPELADRLVSYDGGGANGPDVFAAYRIDEQILKALERKVHLPSGGSLVIDRTEAMTVVDVNTGKYTGSGGNLEETVTKNNLEAAEEMVRQLRLRDIGGIIVIDFIDMVLESNRELVLRRLTEALGRDRTRHQVAEVTSLGLVQMTRKRMGTGLVEAFSEPCPHCGGRGIVLHDLPVVASALEDSSNDRRPAKARRVRGRDADRVEDVIPRVVEPVGRRPDPRGPKPPIPSAGPGRGDAGRGDAGRADAGRGDSGRADSGRGGGGRGDRDRRGGRQDSRPVAAAPLADELLAGVVDADELDWIEAAAAAGIRAAEDADEDGFEAGEPEYADETTGDDDRQEAGEEIIIAIDQPAEERPETDVVDAPIGAAGDGHAAEGVAVDARAGISDSGDVAARSPAGDVVSETQPRRRRGRRAAGRPAGAPATAAQPVDIIVPEPSRAAEQPWAADPAETAVNGGGSTGSGLHHEPASNDGRDGSADIASGDSPVVDQSAAIGAQDTAEPAPRRRRAASRPAGPAAGSAAAEPLIVSIPVDQAST